MSDTAAGLRRKIDSAGELRSVVRTMKAMAASSIGQYEKSVLALGDYYRTVELGLSPCFRQSHPKPEIAGHKEPNGAGLIGAIVFGSDQGLVGQFNQVVADYTIKTLTALPGKPQIWAVGGHVQTRLVDAGLPVIGLFAVPTSVAGITPLVTQIQMESESQRAKGEYTAVYVFHNRPQAGSLYESVSQRLLPLDAGWQRGVAEVQWPTKIVPEVVHSRATMDSILPVLIREYLFISLFRACAESLASENASRLAAMQRADKNIDELMDTLKTTSHRLRQGQIDEELFDVVSGSEAPGGK